MILEALERLGAQASRVMMYPQEWNVSANTRTAKQLRKACDAYNVQLSPIQIQRADNDFTWGDSFTKLLAFNLTQYKRVLSLDSDATVLDGMDELFVTPSTPVAMPRAYWLENVTLSSQLMLIEPSDFEFQRILGAVSHRTSREFDMDNVNELYGESCVVIPHRRYNLLTGEFRSSEHHKYLSSKEEAWDPQKVIDEAKYVHFSDWPLPKPWMPHSDAQILEMQPDCRELEKVQDCRDREVWLSLYADFKERRRVSPITLSTDLGQF